MATLIETIFNNTQLPNNTWLLVFSASLAVLYIKIFKRPHFPPNAPKWYKGGDWPILGALPFYSKRAEFFHDAVRHSETGNFSFYVGKKHVVGLSGREARKTFFDSKDFNFSEGFVELFTGGPTTSAKDKFPQFFNKTLINMTRKENFVRSLGFLTGDTLQACEGLAVAPPSKADPEWMVTDPFVSMYNIVYKLTMRTMGANDIAEDPELLRYTLSVFEQFEKSPSTTRIIFPWMPTPNYGLQLFNGARLAMVIRKIYKKRKETGAKSNDALQFLIDQGTSLKDVISFQIGVLFAGLINSGLNAAWLHLHLTQSPKWMARIRSEVDGVVAKHRSSPEQSPADILETLTVDDWDSEFPFIDTCLRESIRLGIPGTGMRKNSSGHDIPIGSTGEVVPNGAYAVYLLDDIHMNESLYTRPETFDPDRFSRGEDEKVPHGFLGWGSGRHPCLGMKFAKLEMAVITAYFVAMFDFELSDKDGNYNPHPPPPINRNQTQAQKPRTTSYLRYKSRRY
ncbi:hypothetical protein AAE478_008957 [Parahypoxylon ruwenzoriense]